MAVKIVAVLLGFVAAVASFPWLNEYMFAVIALIGAIAVGVVVYLVVLNLLSDLTS